jgi:hypothetical protein
MTTSEPYPTDATSPTIHVQYPSSSRISAAPNSSDSLSCSISQSTGKPITAARGGREGKGKGDDGRENGRVEICSRTSTERQDRISWIIRPAWYMCHSNQSEGEGRSSRRGTGTGGL